MLFNVVGLLLTWDVSSKPPLSLIDRAQCSRCNRDISIFGSIVNTIDFLVVRL